MTTAEAAPELRLRDSLRPALWVWLAISVAWGVLGVLVVQVAPGGNTVGVPGIDAVPITGGWHNFFDVGFRADAYWYLRIATTGYSAHDASSAFFPLYPMLIHIVDWVPGIEPRASAAIVSEGSFFGALTVLHALTRREFGTEFAQRSIRYLAVFPTAFFLLSDLSESTFLFLTLLTFWYARADLWLLALIPGALAGATRSAGAVLFPALVVEALVQTRREGRWWSLRLLGTVGPLIGFFAYIGSWALAGSASAPLDAQKNWGRSYEFPLTTLWNALKLAKQYQSYWLIDAVVVFFVIIVLLVGCRAIPLSYLVFAAGSLVLPLLDPYPDRPLLSMPRFVCVIFPAIWCVAHFVRKRWLTDSLVMGGFAVGFVIVGSLWANSYSIF